MEYLNKILCGRDMDILPRLPAESVNCVVTSPPYWGLRDYGIEPVIWDGVTGCKHKWGSKTITLKHKSGETNPGKEGWFKDKGASDDKGNCFCIKCNAWRGSLGLEPTFELYIKHLCDIFDEVKRVLRKDGTCWVNLGDTYAGGGGWTGVPDDWKSVSTGSKQKRFDHDKKKTGIPAKSLLLIPQRFSIEMVNRGWILRNTIIWHKPNCMPSSAKDRFTVDFEPVFFFTKSNKALFWTNERTLECVSKSPPGTKGIEDEDWEWRECSACNGKGIVKDKICKRCKGSGKVKSSFWTGHDYWFEQQFEEQSLNTHFKGINPKTTDKFRDKSRRVDGKLSHKGWHEYTPLTELPNGRNKRAVWYIPTSPFPEAHFAVYPEKLIEPMIKAGCPRYVCKKCGKARVKMLEPTEEYKKYLGKGNLEEHHAGQETKTKFKVKVNAEYNFKGYTDCDCNAGFEPGVTLDPFIGAGTTAVVAEKLGRNYSGIEIKQEYIDMANKRIKKIPGLLF